MFIFFFFFFFFFSSRRRHTRSLCDWSSDVSSDLRQWLEHCEGFTVLFDIVARFGPTQVERDRGVRFYLRPWGVGLLDPAPAGLDRIVFLEIGRATSELQSHSDLVCRLLLEKKKK